MQRPISEQPNPAEWGLGSHLCIGIAAKAGPNWQDTEDLAGVDWAHVDESARPIEAEDEEDWSDLERAV